MFKYKIRSLILAGCAVVSIGIVLGLKIISNETKRVKNGFTREKSLPANRIKFVDLKYNRYYFAGFTKSTIFLANTWRPGKILEVNKELDTNTISLKYSENILNKWNAVSLNVDSPRVYLSEGISPFLIEGTHQNPEEAVFNSSTKLPFFLSASHISDSLWVLDSYSPKIKQKFFSFYSTSKRKSDSLFYMVEKQVDGLFCSQGTINYDQAKQMIVFTFMYRNQFLCLDKNMKLLYKANTIDTVTTADIKIVNISSNKTSLSSPPSIVNKYSCIDKNLLFIQSNLTGDNESFDLLEKVYPIDVYGLDKGSYLGSFYLPSVLNGDKLISFRVKDGIVYVLYDHHLALYELRKKFL